MAPSVGSSQQPQMARLPEPSGFLASQALAYFAPSCRNPGMLTSFLVTLMPGLSASALSRMPSRSRHTWPVR